jgi:hypothetical protein
MFICVRLKFNALFLFAVFFSACVQQVDFEIKDVRSQLVVNAVVEGNNDIIVHVSSLQTMVDTTSAVIENATVIIDINKRVDTLLYNPSDGFYHTHLCALPGDVLRLSVWVDGYPEVTACDTMPHSIKILDASLQESLTIDEFGDYHDDYTLTFEKESGMLNYYEFFMVFHSWDAEDSVCSISFPVDAVTVDPLISSSNSNEFNFCTYLFNDAALSEGRYTLRMKMNKGRRGSGEYNFPLLRNCPKKCRAVVLRRVSRAYYDYQNAWGKHIHHQNNDEKIDDIIFLPLIGETSEMYSNVENGFGVFVTYNQDYFIVE